ncbi:MAG: recombination mediator RecR [Brevinema sp.]
MLPKAITHLSKLLTKIPNVGPKSAEKIAIWFSQEGQNHAKELGNYLLNLSNYIGVCPQCGYFSIEDNQLCLICSDIKRDSHILCLVEDVLDIIDIEETASYQGRYFVLGGVISPLEGKTISSLPFDRLKNIITETKISELIIALGATTEGDVTSMYLKEFLSDTNIKLSILARGISVGTKIHFAGKKSIIQAFRTRESLE